MQCKNIPDEPVLAFLADMPCWPGTKMHMWGTWGPGPYVNSVSRAMPPGTPDKLALAKMRQMIRKGVVTGCPCGCRGDFEITDKGRARLRATTP